MDSLTLTRGRDVQPYELNSAQLIVDHAQKDDPHALGFLTRYAIRQYHQEGRTVLLHRNCDLVGYALWSDNRYRERRIIQIWVRGDSRLIEHGRALIDWLVADARTKRIWVLRLYCAEDLEANIFWRTLGFQYVGWRWGSAKKSRRHNLWRRTIGV